MLIELLAGGSLGIADKRGQIRVRDLKRPAKQRTSRP